MSTLTRNLLTAAAVAALAACGNGGETESTQGGDGSDGGETAAATVSLTDFDIDAPSNVESGAQLTVVNDGDVAHTFTAEEGADFDTGTLEPGDETSVTVDGSGEVSYVCTLHPQQMQGSFEVTG